jgi:hypothetical protein
MKRLLGVVFTFGALLLGIEFALEATFKFSLSMRQPAFAATAFLSVLAAAIGCAACVIAAKQCFRQAREASDQMTPPAVLAHK